MRLLFIIIAMFLLDYGLLAQSRTGPLMIIDKIIVNADSSTVFSILNSNNINSHVFIESDSAMNILGEIGSFGAIIIETTDKESERRKQLTKDPYRYGDGELKVLVGDQLHKQSIMASIDPHTIEHISVLYPLDAIIKYGQECMNGLIVIKLGKK